MAALIVATKFNEDLIYKNSHYAKVGGVSLEELNLLEHYFLETISYNIYIDPEQYALCSDYLLESIKSNLDEQENEYQSPKPKKENKETKDNKERKDNKEHKEEIKFSSNTSNNKPSKEKEYRAVSNLSTANSSFKSVSSKCDFSTKKQTSKKVKV